jgi:hypothetical protein
MERGETILERAGAQEGRGSEARQKDCSRHKGSGEGVFVFKPQREPRKLKVQRNRRPTEGEGGGTLPDLPLKKKAFDSFLNIKKCDQEQRNLST